MIFHRLIVPPVHAKNHLDGLWLLKHPGYTHHGVNERYRLLATVEKNAYDLLAPASNQQ